MTGWSERPYGSSFANTHRDLSEDDNAMDEDVPMDEDPKPARSDGLEQYDLDNYDDEEAMPCTPAWHVSCLYFTHSPKPWVHSATSRGSLTIAITTKTRI